MGVIGSSGPGLPCARGRYCPAGVEQEVLCPPGTFTPHQGAISEVTSCSTTAGECLFLHALFHDLRVIDFSTAYNTCQAQSYHVKFLFWNILPISLQLPINCDGIIAVYLGKTQWLYKNQFCSIWMKNSLLLI